MMELKHREGFGYLKLKEKNNYEFEITYPTLRHIVTDILLNRKFPIESLTDDGIETKIVTAEAHFYGVLKDAIDSRQYIYKTLSEVSSDTSISFENFKIKKLFNSVYVDYSQSVDIIDKIFYTKDQLRHLPISATPKLEKLLIEWHYSFTNNKENELKKRKRLLNYIRPIGSVFDESPYLKRLPDNTEPQPLLFHLNYYYKEQTQKLRSDNRFLEWGIRYLLDFNLIPNCYVEVEQYVFEKKMDEPESKYKLKPELQYLQQLPENYRLRIRDNQINIAVKNTSPTSNKPEYHKFRMGEKVMKYLLYALFDKKRNQQKTVDDFIIAISNDYAKFFTQDEIPLTENSFKLLESFSIPTFLYKVSSYNEGVKINHQPLRLELTVALDKKINWINNQLELSKTYNRNQKNEAILKAYTFFDFSKVEHKKFLRKNEYEQMSICHYMLNQNKDKVISLLAKTFKIKERLPEEIYSIIKTVIDGVWEKPVLDILFAKVFEDRRDFLMSLKAMVTDDELPIKLIKPQLSFLNLSISDSNLKEVNRIERQKKRKESLNFLPFSLHPALVLKYFYPDDFAAKKFDGNVPHSKGENKYNNLFAELRKNPVQSNILEKDYYNLSAFEDLYYRVTSVITNEEEKLNLKKRLRTLNGKIIDTHTKDVFLSLIAQRYLENYDSILANEFAKLRGKRMINIAGLFKKEVIIRISKNTFAGKMEEYTEEEKKMIPNQLFICFRLHQADDYFFRMKKNELGQLALHFINFRNEELAYYNDDADLYNKIAEWPDGTKLKPIPLGQLMQELKNITIMGKRLMKNILQYERKVIDNYIIEVQTKDSGKSKQDCLTAISSGKDYLSFAEILELDKITENSIKKAVQNLRNSCLHNKIPIKQSYSEQTLPGSAVANALSITERIAPDRRKYLQYE